MIATCKRGVPVEVYFKQFSRYQGGKHVIEKQEFSDALKGLGLKWAEPHRVSDLFDALDVTANGQYSRQITITDIG
jgi:hypothetical protein